MNNAIIITTINKKTRAIDQYQEIDECNIILVGDKKSPHIESSDNLVFLSVDDQNDLKYNYVEVCPYNHYARKNIGYLYAIEKGVDIIIDTDDDNFPMKNWHLPDFVSKKIIDQEGKFINVYNYFTDKRTWPRGFPLNQILNSSSVDTRSTPPAQIGVWQGLANGDPDVDAIYRLTDNTEVIFDDHEGVYLPEHKYCPFNSQNTFWKKEFFPLLYLPATVSFRFTDIMRGYIAQRVLWQHDHHLGFMGATVFQERNQHDYMHDFEDEIEVYLNTQKLIDILDSINLTEKLNNNLLVIYEKLYSKSLVKADELELLRLWIDDLNNLT